MRVNGVEDKQLFLNKICEALQESNTFGNTHNNTLKEIRYVRDANGNEIARPILEDGTGEDGWYDVNINCDSCIGIYGDLWRQFISRF